MEAILASLPPANWLERKPGLYWRSVDTTSKTTSRVASKTSLQVHYQAYLVASDTGSLELLDATFEGDLSSPLVAKKSPISFVLGTSSTVEAWDLVLSPSETHRGVHIGEGIEILSSANFAYGEAGSPPNVPSNATLLFKLVVVSSSALKNDPAVLAKAATSLKDEGNTFFKLAKYAEAAATYTKALDKFRFVYPEEESLQETISGIKLVCNLNRSACQLKIGDFAGAKQSCSDALYLDPKNVKALYRRAQANSGTYDFDRAYKDIIAAIKLNPADTTLRDEFNKIKERQTDYEKRTQEALAQLGKGLLK